MITNDAELEVVRKQLARVEAALDSLRREVKPKNEKTYQLMAETSIDLLHALRSEIDAYLGIAPLPVRADRKHTAAEGVIRSVDLDAQTFVLRERPDRLADLECEYSRQLEGAVKEWLGGRVTVSGTLETSRLTGKEKMEAEAIAPAASEEETATVPTAGDQRQPSPMVGT
jgi:hypothetical protein